MVWGVFVQNVRDGHASQLKKSELFTSTTIIIIQSKHITVTKEIVDVENQIRTPHIAFDKLMKTNIYSIYGWSVWGRQKIRKTEGRCLFFPSTMAVRVLGLIKKASLNDSFWISFYADNDGGVRFLCSGPQLWQWKLIQKQSFKIIFLTRSKIGTAMANRKKWRFSFCFIFSNFFLVSYNFRKISVRSVFQTNIFLLFCFSLIFCRPQTVQP